MDYIDLERCLKSSWIRLMYNGMRLEYFFKTIREEFQERPKS